jgi:hypothetical protein
MWMYFNFYMKLQTQNTIGNYHFIVSLKLFHYDATLNEKVIIYAVEHGNMTTGHIYNK